MWTKSHSYENQRFIQAHASQGAYLRRKTTEGPHVPLMENGLSAGLLWAPVLTATLRHEVFPKFKAVLEWLDGSQLAKLFTSLASVQCVNAIILTSPVTTS